MGVVVQVMPMVWKALSNWLKMADGLPTVEKLLALSGERSQGTTKLLAGTTEEETSLIYAAMQVSEPSFTRIWDNSEDDVYDDL
ncbi:MAG: hypothetical protein F6K11_26670 [Leptolyngbya sp. SIO3F4]|nr:hypothetical protein [Leptolyngbya sp. SIO3F4]